MTRDSLTLIGRTLIAAFSGCSSNPDVETPTTSESSSSGTKYLLSSAPADPRDVIAVRESAENDQDVVVIGRIGGGTDPWVEDMAAFTLVDRSLAACTDIPGDNCPTPWDYCCVTDQLPGATTFVKVVDDQGQIVPTGARELLGVSELQTVVIKGKARKDADGNVTVLASGVYIDPTNPGQVKHEHAAHDHEHAGHNHDDHHHDGDASPPENDADPAGDQ